MHIVYIIRNFIINLSIYSAQKQSETEDVEPLQRINTDFDERLIIEVMNRPSLYDFRLNIKERSKLKKSALWEEVRNTIGGMLKY